MQARMRRNRIALITAVSLCFTTTCGISGSLDAMRSSKQVETVYAATTGMDAAVTGEHSVIGPMQPGSGDSRSFGNDTLYANGQWKADLSEYDDSLSLVRYETVQNEQDPLTTTSAVTTDTKSESATTTYTTCVEPTITAPHTIQASPNSIVFYTSGYGHGVGMSQNGANFYAKYDGWSYDQILSLYYPGTTLVQTGVSADKVITIGNCTGDIVSVIAQVINREMGPSMAPEALKAQAVAIYSFYLHNGGRSYGLKGKANPSQKIIDAVESVLGQALYYNGAPALTMFYASSGGCTASCKDIFYMNLPYLVSVPVEHDESSDPHYNDTVVFSYDQLKNRLERTYQITLTGSPYDWIELHYGDGGYVAYAVIGGQVTVKGNALRDVLGLKSPKFEFVYQSGSEAPEVEQVTTTAVSYLTTSATHAPISVLTTSHASTTTTTTTTATVVETTKAAESAETSAQAQSVDTRSETAAETE